jgi:predicted SprT family Zn-dependent metalloprotease
MNIPDKLIADINNKIGHWEKEEIFCYRCGQLMTKINNLNDNNKNEIFECRTCNIMYNNKQKTYQKDIGYII